MAVAAVAANVVGAQFVSQSDPYFTIFCMFFLFLYETKRLTLKRPKSIIFQRISFKFQNFSLGLNEKDTKLYYNMIS